MGKRLDITDQIFGRLKAIVTDWYKTKKTGRTYWFCQCEDNNIVSVSIGDLRSGNTKSCGCLCREDITDQIFGRLLVLVIDWYKTKETGFTYWFCQCECGNIISVDITSLKRGNTKSCGCLQKEIVSKIGEDKREDLTGQLFTRWLVESYNSEKSKKVGRPHWNVVCTYDGNRSCVSANNLKRGKSKSCGCLHKENNSGKNSNLWKGGITPLYNKIRNSIEYTEFVQEILKKVNYICQLTKEIGGDLHVHHIKSFAKILEENNITTKEQAFECKELWDEKNVIVLREEWHLGQRTKNLNAFHRIYGTRNFTEEDFYTWFNEFKIEKKIR